MGDQGEFDFSEQQENLERVASRIGRPILDFCRERVGKRFYADELRRYVIREAGIVAPASADRILRDLRKRRKLDYVVVSRRESLYEVVSVGRTA